jgi:DNA polymerase-1
MKKILVIDGNSIINRAFYGIRPLTTKSGKHTNAIYGMINIISKQLNAIKPDYAAVAFDVKHPTFRHEMYAEYKAGRHPTPEELLSQFADAKECLKLMGFHIMELPGYEADDIQGTIAKMAHQSPDTVSYVLSGDRDLLQLIDDKVTVLLVTNTETKEMDESAFRNEYGIPPSDFIDMKALMGDSSDNIPGVAGIGKKTAEGLIQGFGCLDKIYENIDDPAIKKGVREKLLKDKDNAYLSKTLATINTSAPIGKELSELRYEGISEEELYAKFLELELNSLIQKFGLKGGSKKAAPEKKASEPKEEKSKTDGQVEMDFLAPEDDTEYAKCNSSEILKITENRVSIEFLESKLYIFAGNKAFLYEDDIKDISEFFKNKTVICYDAKSLIYKIPALIEAELLDLMIYDYVINPSQGRSATDALISVFLGAVPKSGAPTVKYYDDLEAKMRDRIAEDGMIHILDEIELPLVKILYEIEKNGFKIDPSGMREFGEALDELARDLTERIYMQAGREFNINSPKQLGEILFVEMGLPYQKKKTKTGYSTDAQTLEELRYISPIIDDILEYRQVTKLKNTYADALPVLADENNRIHTDFKQALTATGRLSSADPNLQNIPIKTKMGREMRRYFITDEGYTLVDADYSQIELRLLAHIADDYNMREAFINGEDIHRKTAAAVFGLPEEAVNEEMRKRAKAVNFGIVYGISGFSLSKDIGTTVSEASKYIKNYLMNYPSIDTYLEEVVEEAKEKGYTTTVHGRRRYIPELNAPNAVMRGFGKRVAMNAPIQGSAADIMKIAMIRTYERLKKEGLDARIVMQVHDELIVEAKDSQVDLVKAILKEEMEGSAKLSIPLTVEVSTGKNWLEQE